MALSVHLYRLRRESLPKSLYIRYGKLGGDKLGMERNMTHKSQYAKAMTTLIALALFVTGCTKTRDAALPEDAQESNFSIAEVDSLQTESQMQVQTDEHLSELSLGESSKATAEKGIVAVTDVKVPNRLKYMFKGLEMSGQAGRSYPITLSVDKQFVTAYKIVNDASELSILEKQLAQVKEEVVLQKELQKTKDNSKVKSLMAKLKAARAQKVSALGKKGSNILVPIFKFKVTGYGILQRAKNELKEETSTLRLKDSDWSEATHFTMSVNSSDRLPVGLDPSSQGEMDRTFVMDRINNKIMTAGTLKSEFQIPLNTSDDTRILTLLDVDALHVFEVGQFGKTDLTDSQMQQLKSESNQANVRKCSDEIKNTLPEAERANCILVLRYDVPVSYVKPELPVVDYDGNQDAKISFKRVRSGENVGLVQIEQNVEAKKVESNNQLDPRTTIRIADIKGKEFFFKRTLEEASFSAASPGLAPGMAGSITIVKFDFEENRIVLRRADKLINLKASSTDVDYEEILSLPVRYKKLETKDSTGAAYSMPRLVDANRTDADYIEVDWTRNTIAQVMSPYSAIYDGCILNTADQQVADMDMRLSQGVLNFSQKYTVSLMPECMAEYRVSNDYNGAPTYQFTARISERVSLKLNDHSTDTAFIKELPFKAQNAMGFGVWTTGRVNPTERGERGIEGTEENRMMVHDFRNGKVLKYTITGLPTDDPESRKIYLSIAEELINSWNLAYRQAFKGSSLERSGPYITYEIAGENGVTAHLGDLDKNIFHFENKYADHGILGVSQVGFNPRSAIVVADSLILYAGNVKADVLYNYNEMKLRTAWEAQKEQFLKKAEADLAKEEEADKKAQTGVPSAAKAPAEEKVAAAEATTRRLLKTAQFEKLNKATDMVQAIKGAKIRYNDLMRATKVKQSLEGKGQFAYSSPRDSSGWMDKVIKTVSKNPNMTPSDIQAVLAKEFLEAKGDALSVADKANLQAVIKEQKFRTRLQAALHRTAGCMKTTAETTNANYAKLSFNEAFRIEALNTMVHEMGHSQGLTHNFIASYDKANYANEDGSASKRNYSSVMDYLTPGKFSWDGLGTYDIRAIRASHLGLLEVTPQFKEKLGANAAKVLVQDKYISIDTIKQAFAKDGWSNFTKASIKGVLKPYKYCTDIHVGVDPMCQRHDFGSSATEVVESIINDLENNYVSRYHGWNRLNYSLGNAFRASAITEYYMFRMRTFMDETFYKLVTRDYESQDEVNDFANAAIKSYLYYLKLITTPDTTASFKSAERFIAVPYVKAEENEKGEPTGKKFKKVAIIEKRALQPIHLGDIRDRIDTMGIEFDKIAAIDLLTMKGYPSYKYSQQSINFSFLDFEKYILGMNSESSIVTNILTGMMLNQLQPTFTNEDVTLQPIPNETSNVTAAMRAYAGIYGILNLEESTLEGKDNFANLFKVGSSVGAAPSDRIALSQLGVDENSKTKLTFWALDNATSAQQILQIAASKNFFIRNSKDITTVMEKLVMAQITAMFSKQAKEQASQDTTQDDGVKKAKAELVAKLNELNKTGQIVSEEQLKANPGFSIEAQVEEIANFNEQMIQISFALLTGNQQVAGMVSQLAKQAADLADQAPLIALDQKALVTTLTQFGELMAKQSGQKQFAELGQKAGEILSEQSLETSYGLIMKNIEFLSMLTRMTNPEYNR